MKTIETSVQSAWAVLEILRMLVREADIPMAGNVALIQCSHEQCTATTIPCRHSFCRGCIADFQASLGTMRRLTCPACRAPKGCRRSSRDERHFEGMQIEPNFGGVLQGNNAVRALLYVNCISCVCDECRILTILLAAVVITLFGFKISDWFS